MAWRAVTEDDLLTRMSGDELAALRESSLGTGQSDPVSEHIDQVTEMVRGYIAAHSANTLGESGTLPERLIRPACDILVMDVSTRSGGILIDISDTRKTAHDNAVRLLEQVAQGNYAVEQPETAGDDSEAAPSPSLYDRTRNFERTDQEGI